MVDARIKKAHLAMRPEFCCRCSRKLFALSLKHWSPRLSAVLPFFYPPPQKPVHFRQIAAPVKRAIHSAPMPAREKPLMYQLMGANI
jgi:hypothetical protein